MSGSIRSCGCGYFPPSVPLATGVGELLGDGRVLFITISTNCFAAASALDGKGTNTGKVQRH